MSQWSRTNSAVPPDAEPAAVVAALAKTGVHPAARISFFAARMPAPVRILCSWSIQICALLASSPKTPFHVDQAVTLSVTRGTTAGRTPAGGPSPG